MSNAIVGIDVGSQKTVIAGDDVDRTKYENAIPVTTTMLQHAIKRFVVFKFVCCFDH